MRYILRLEGPRFSAKEVCYETGRGMVGAYRAGIIYMDGIQGEYCETATHPCPSDIYVTRDGKPITLHLVMDDDTYFGFASVDQARRWWYHREDLKVAAAAGYRMVAIPVEDVRDIELHGRHQLTYRPLEWGRGDCPVIRRVYFDPTWLHTVSQEDLEAWVDEKLEIRQVA